MLNVPWHLVHTSRSRNASSGDSTTALIQAAGEASLRKLREASSYLALQICQYGRGELETLRHIQVVDTYRADRALRAHRLAQQIREPTMSNSHCSCEVIADYSDVPVP